MHVANLAQRIFRQQVTEILHQKKIAKFWSDQQRVLWYVMVFLTCNLNQWHKTKAENRNGNI